MTLHGKGLLPHDDDEDEHEDKVLVVVVVVVVGWIPSDEVHK